VNGYRFALDCIRCGGVLVPVTSSKTFGTETSAIARCSSCKSQYQVTVILRPMAWRPEDNRSLVEVAACGTEAGHQRHRRAGEEPCDACRRAHVDGQVGRKAARRALARAEAAV